MQMVQREAATARAGRCGGIVGVFYKRRGIGNGECSLVQGGDENLPVGQRDLAQGVTKPRSNRDYRAAS